MTRKKKSLPEDPELLLKEARALEMHTRGTKWEQIAADLGYANASGAWKAAQRALARYPAREVDEQRNIQNEQLRQLISQAWDIYDRAVLAGDDELALKAQDRIGKFLDRQSKLNGLDAPVKTDVTSGGEPLQVVVHRDWDGVVDDGDGGQ